MLQIGNFKQYLENSNSEVKHQNDLLLTDDSLPKIMKFFGKMLLIQSQIKILEEKKVCSFNHSRMIGSIKLIISKIVSNIQYLNKNHIFTEDFHKTLCTILKASSLYAKAFNSIIDPINEKEFISKLLVDIENFSLSIFQFSTIFNEIMNSIMKLNNSNDPHYHKTLTNLNLRLGIECALFNYSVNVQPIETAPYFKSNFIQVYSFYDTISSISSYIVPIESFCGTGKTTVIPLILFCKNLKENNNAPFILMTLPNQSNVDSKQKLFSRILSKYVTVTSDSKIILKNLNDSEKVQKMTLGILTPHRLPKLLYKFRYKKRQLVPQIRFIIDDIIQQSFHLSVILSKFSDFERENLFKIPLNVVLLSSAFPSTIMNFFKKPIETIKLIESSQFKVRFKSVTYQFINKIYPKFQKRIKSVIYEMAQEKSEIEEGHILCFLPNISFCKELKYSITTELTNEFIENQTANLSKKVIILKTSLKPNESYNSFINRLTSELTTYEKKKEKFIYFLPLVISGKLENTLNLIIQNDLNKVKKLIFSTPVLESFNINDLSVVIDSGLVKEEEFNNSIGLNIFYEKLASKESKFLRYGRLGRTMNGLYILFKQENQNNFDDLIPSIKKHDLTTNLLQMKQIKIDFEKLNLNLSDKPSRQNLDYAIKTLKQIKAIDEKTLEITPFGNDLLRFDFIPIWYLAAVIRYSENFVDQEDKNLAYFITAYISTIISKDKLLVKDEMSEFISNFFDEDSDLVTLFYALKSLLTHKEIENEFYFRNFVESSGFSYSEFIDFRSDLQKIVDYTFPKKTVKEVIEKVDLFIKKNNGLYHVIDEFIEKLDYPRWKQIHLIRFNDVRNTENFQSPEIVFLADSKLAFFKNQPSGKVFLRKRPGWKGINVPSNCYCFNIQYRIERNENQVFKKYTGHLIHRQRQNKVKSIEIKSLIALNPWFDVLLKTYLKDEDIGLVSDYKFGGNFFHYQQSGGSVYLSYISYRDDAYIKIKQAIDDCLKLLPYTPRSVLIYNNKLNAITEITSIGSDKYDCFNATKLPGDVLNKSRIESCIANIDELKKSKSKFRLCSLFVNESCEFDVYDTSNLYIIDMQNQNARDLLSVVKERCDQITIEKQKINKSLNDSKKIGSFQFSPRFIHPSLIYHKETRKCITKWLSTRCPFIENINIKGHKFEMKCSEISQLQEYIHSNPDEIKKEMNLNYVAIPFPKNIFKENKLEIDQQTTWKYNYEFNVMIVTKKESENVIKFLNEKKSVVEISCSYFKEKDIHLNSSLCIDICDNEPGNQDLTNSPISIFFENGESHTSKLCRDCLYKRLIYVTESYYSNENIKMKPLHLYPIHSVDYCDGFERWPQIPFGQLVSVLVNNNDDKLSSLASAYLNSINEFTVRQRMKYDFTYCPNHPQKLYRIEGASNKLIKCDNEGCINYYCPFCHEMHPKKANCLLKEKKYLKICPGCGTPVEKFEGCNHMDCIICDTIFCYECLKVFDSVTKADDHFLKFHGSFYSSFSDDDTLEG